MKHIAKLRKRIKYWQKVGSQAVQDICQRIEKAYQLFFKNNKKGTRPPNFKKTRKYKSFTLKQAGYKLLGGNRIKIGKQIYKFALSREIKGKIKTITVKRNPLGELFILVVTDREGCSRLESISNRGVDYMDEQFGVVTGKIAGFDFGLKTFLTVSDGTTIDSPLFFNKFRSLLRKANQNLANKKKGSNNWHKAKKHLARVHEFISNKRKDWFWKLAHELTYKYDVLIFDGEECSWSKSISNRRVD